MCEMQISSDVNKQIIKAFLDNSAKEGNRIYRMEIYHKGEIKVRMALPPYSCDDKQQLYSLSKTFTATAIGMLVDDGLLSVEDRVIDLFPDKAPENVSENLSKLCVKHLLSMNTGHKDCFISEIYNGEDMVKSFLAHNIEYEPGTYFTYNNGATFMLSAIVTKITGLTLFDFLSERLFEPLGIEGVHWDAYNNGISMGAVGLHASIDDITKLGVLYLNKGMYNGKRILSEKWVSKASSFVSDNSDNGNPDWCAGYGYQIWLNARGGFRGDGAFGQLCMVRPDLNMVLCVQAFCDDMQKEIDGLIDVGEALYDKTNTSDDELRESMAKYTPSKTDVLPDGYLRRFKCYPNKMGITCVKFEKNADNGVCIKISDGKRWQTIKSGYGEYLKSTICIKELKPMLIDIASAENVEKLTMASYYTIENGTLKIHIRYLCAPHTDEIDFVIDGDMIRVIPMDTDLRKK